ncbi:STAS-like domain-containing protein [Glaesserella parasuis]|uniref:DUF4325 domain-containing protein n=1 Tax=Glaesserella parasuis TaxID=738 RepID=A0AAJ6AER5_GLAPU|nr:DUF4325 domain-containing protein [Glaesserella parasuis]MCT8655349.1 STAS-like domain-containing protein [Glaesserella parasuis]MCT8836483.1 STAS-like domain-containing protein [Glaesserella parasuis]MDG6309252.1 DUF4325 domain-containing protein [Glaesserella parasuis]MDG6360804.1 DUF4325 domain-containing protein [Glaesserella parasuis]MDG6409288.1 DUF4325 domain-containing protein [Glaesserella parasuis]
MTEKIINVCKDFSTDPWGRFVTDNPLSSGEAFRKEYLLQAFKENDKVTVDFSDLEYVPDSSFLGEAFIGLVKSDHFSYEEVLSKLNILPKDGFYPELIKRLFMLAKNENVIL